MNANEFNEYIRLISEGKKEEAHSLREKSIPDRIKQINGTPES